MYIYIIYIYILYILYYIYYILYIYIYIYIYIRILMLAVTLNPKIYCWMRKCMLKLPILEQRLLSPKMLVIIVEPRYRVLD